MAFVPGPLAEQWVVSGYRSLGVDDVGEAGSQVADGVLGERVGL